MNFNYTFPKRKFNNESVINKMNIFFRNGDFFVLSGSEIVDISVRFYDNLIFFNDGWSPVAESGFIKLKLKSKGVKYESPYLYNRKEYSKGRISYIENRLINEGGISHVRLFNENCYSDFIFGDIYATKEDDFVVLHFRSNDIYGPYESERYTVSIGDIRKENIRKIDVSLENCDSFSVFNDDIIDMHLDFDKELYWNSGNFVRRISGGYIKLFLDKDIDCRDINIYSEKKRQKQDSLIKNRLCGKSKEPIDICHLYIHSNYAGYGIELEECIEAPYLGYENESYDFAYNPYVNLRDEDDYIYCDDDDDDEDYYDDDEPFISGYAEKQKDGSILIVFGKEK